MWALGPTDKYRDGIAPIASAEAVVDAGPILCVDTTASSRSVGCAGVMPQGQQVHQFTGFSLLRAKD